MHSIPWRLLIMSPQHGALNMAIDQAIMESVAAEDVPPTLRFYAWQPPCLSLGYMQKIAEVNQGRIAERGWQIVRRLTGGRAILHTDELTYSVAVKREHPIVEGDIVASYRRISRAFVAGLQRLGAAPEADKRIKPHPDAKGPVCFEVPSHYEITVNAKKLVGSAQVRKFGAVLQHGTLPLTGDITRILDALAFDTDAQRERLRERVRSRATTLTGAMGRPVTWEQAVDAMIAGFETTFGLTFERAEDLMADERNRANELHDERYATDAWTTRF